MTTLAKFNIPGLRDFTDLDWMGFQGAERFKDGEVPKMVEGPNDRFNIVLAGCGIDVLLGELGEDEACWSLNTQRDELMTVKEALILARIILVVLDECSGAEAGDALKRIGFERTM